MVSGLYISTKTIPLSLRQIKNFLGDAMPQNTMGHNEMDLIMVFFGINLRSKRREQNSQGSQSQFLSRRH